MGLDLILIKNFKEWMTKLLRPMSAEVFFFVLLQSSSCQPYFNTSEFEHQNKEKKEFLRIHDIKVKFE